MVTTRDMSLIYKYELPARSFCDCDSQDKTRPLLGNSLVVPVVSALSLLRAQVQSLVRELRSRRPCGPLQKHV